MRSRPTLSFFILVALAAVATYGSLLLSSQSEPIADLSDIPASDRVLVTEPETTGTLSEVLQQNTAKLNSLAEPELADTTDWEEFIDDTHYLSFKYPSTWTIRTYPDREGFYIIAVRPDKGDDNIRIYISPTDYFATDGLTYRPDTISGVTARNINNMIFGVKYAAQYYTFNLGRDIELLPEFNAMIKTVAFSR